MVLYLAFGPILLLLNLIFLQPFVLNVLQELTHIEFTDLLLNTFLLLPLAECLLPCLIVDLHGELAGALADVGGVLGSFGVE